MVRALRFMSAEYREGRPTAAPHRKNDEHVLGEDMEWQLAETARNKLDDEEVEMRLAAEIEEAECVDRQGPHWAMEELMIATESARCVDQQESECVGEESMKSEYPLHCDTDEGEPYRPMRRNLRESHDCRKEASGESVSPRFNEVRSKPVDRTTNHTTSNITNAPSF